MAVTKAATPGHRLLSTTIDDIALADPERVWAWKLRSSSPQDGSYEKVTFKALANAINRLSHFLQAHLGAANGPHTFMYLGRPDMRYYMIAVASSKIGGRVLFSSHMNSLAAHLNLIRKTSCEALFSASGVNVADILAEEPLQHKLVPELDELLDAAPAKPFPFTRTFEEAQFDEFVILHSSGTTGLPKPIVLNNGFVAGLDAMSTLPDVDPSNGFRRGLMNKHFDGPSIIAFAPFHAICINGILALSVFANLVQVWGHPDRLMGLDDVVSCLTQTQVPIKAAAIAPNLLEGLVRSDQGMHELAKLRKVYYAGSMLNKVFAEKLVAHGVQLFNWWGTTETGTKVFYEMPPEDWNYLSVDPNVNGIEWHFASQEVSNEEFSGELYEMVIVRRPEIEPYSMVFRRLPGVNEWRPGDLWEKHPTKKHTWRYYGRADDLICFSNGLKLHPVAIENNLNSHAYVQSTLLYGAQRQQVVALVELNDAGYREADKSGIDRVKESIWARVQEINKETQKISQVDKTHIIIVKEDKPFPRVTKGSLQRVAAVKEYMPEIDECYQKHGDKMPLEMMDRLTNGNGVKA